MYCIFYIEAFLIKTLMFCFDELLVPVLVIHFGMYLKNTSFSESKNCISGQKGWVGELIGRGWIIWINMVIPMVVLMADSEVDQ